MSSIWCVLNINRVHNNRTPNLTHTIRPHDSSRHELVRIRQGAGDRHGERQPLKQPAERQLPRLDSDSDVWPQAGDLGGVQGARRPDVGDGAREADGEVLTRLGVVRHRRVVEVGGGTPFAAAEQAVALEPVTARSCVELYPSAHSMRT